MGRPSVLLIQIRSEGDPMRAHEETCIRRRLERCDIALHTRNAGVQRPQADWLEGVDALIIGGSGAFSVCDSRSGVFVDPLRHVLERALGDGTPGFGICFGHQLLGYHLGGRLETLEPHAEIGTIDLELTPTGAQDPVFGALTPQFRAQAGHSDSITQIPAGVELLVSNATLDAQAFRVTGSAFYSTQFHPDLSGQEARNRYLAYQAGMAESVSSADVAAADKFVPGEDAATLLLERFIHHALS